VKVVPSITAERSTFRAIWLNEARMQFVGKMVSDKNAVRCSGGFQGTRARLVQSELRSMCDHMAVTLSSTQSSWCSHLSLPISIDHRRETYGRTLTCRLLEKKE
jgi:hypothetical protein